MPKQPEPKRLYTWLRGAHAWLRRSEIFIAHDEKNEASSVGAESSWNVGLLQARALRCRS
jgi:hypothetical protein